MEYDFESVVLRCKQCEKVFFSKSKKLQFCSSCRKKRKVKSQKDSNAKKASRKNLVLRRNGRGIEDIAAAANDAGMSYGKYVALYELG